LSLFWFLVRLERWLYARTEKTWLGCLYTACIRYPMYLFLDTVRDPRWR